MSCIMHLTHVDGAFHEGGQAAARPLNDLLPAGEQQSCNEIECAKCCGLSLGRGVACASRKLLKEI